LITLGIGIVLLVVIMKGNILVILVGYLLPIVLELILAIYLQELVNCGLLFLICLPIPICTIVLAGIMPVFGILDSSFDKYICMILFYNMYFSAGFRD